MNNVMAFNTCQFINKHIALFPVSSLQNLICISLWTGRPGVLWFMGSQRVGHDWATELNWTDLFHGRSSGQGSPGPDTVLPRGLGFEAGGQDWRDLVGHLQASGKQMFVTRCCDRWWSFPTTACSLPPHLLPSEGVAFFPKDITCGHMTNFGKWDVSTHACGSIRRSWNRMCFAPHPERVNS